MLNWLVKLVISGFGDAKGREEKKDRVCAVLGILYRKISKMVRRDGGKGKEGKLLCILRYPLLVSPRKQGSALCANPRNPYWG